MAFFGSVEKKSKTSLLFVEMITSMFDGDSNVNFFEIDKIGNVMLSMVVIATSAIFVPVYFVNIKNIISKISMFMVFRCLNSR